jgi:hypothetical protein
MREEKKKGERRVNINAAYHTRAYVVPCVMITPHPGSGGGGGGGGVGGLKAMAPRLT